MTRRIQSSRGDTSPDQPPTPKEEPDTQTVSTIYTIPFKPRAGLAGESPQPSPSANSAGIKWERSGQPRTDAQNQRLYNSQSSLYRPSDEGEMESSSSTSGSDSDDRSCSDSDHSPPVAAQEYVLPHDHRFQSSRPELVKSALDSLDAWMKSARYVLPPDDRLPPRKRLRTLHWKEGDGSDDSIDAPARYQQCLLQHDLRSIEDVMRHLRRHHMKPLYCPRLNFYQKTKLKRRDRIYLGETKRWQRIYATAFPKSDPAYSPYLDRGCGKAVSMARDYWRANGRLCVCQFLERGMTLGEEEEGRDRVAEDALCKLALEDMLCVIAQRYGYRCEDFDRVNNMNRSSMSTGSFNEGSPLIWWASIKSPVSVPAHRNGDCRASLRRGSSTIGFLFDSKYTPGLDSQNFALRHLAYSWHTTKVTLLSSMLCQLPPGYGPRRHYYKLGWNPIAVFTINLIAIMPLAAVMSFATKEISLRLGETMGGLLNATFGNAVELIFSIVALKEKHIDIVQASMLGSILSNLSLVMGMCFLFGGIVHRGSTGNDTEQVFSSATAQTTCSLMALSSASLIIPAALSAVLDQSGFRDKDQSILALSRGTAIILLVLYVLYFVFKLRTHSNLFDAENQNSDEREEPSLGTASAVAVLVVTTIMVSICADYLVGSINSLVETSGISRAFIGLILIPIVGNAAEHVTAVIVAVRDKMDLAMSVAVGSSIQISLLVTPCLVIVSWALGSDMSFRFETFQTAVFFVSVLAVTYTVQDGKSNYLEGAMLLGLYAIIALAFLVIPSSLVSGGLQA
ncbi:hypothetical protein MRS44_017805 [Fusarium solani]|uniref:uncharacterized protein n=1 Tax=Fusarium solani TaxID=169388 RepID=UPI0032C47930|nr:hypothetical protein MRS44_017805 [Fusarium solani]